MQKDIVIEAEKRTQMGKNAARRLRRADRIPAVVYGGDAAPVPLAVDPRSVEAILRGESGANTLFGLKVLPDGIVPGRFMIKEHQVDPVTEGLVHADLMRISMDRAIRVHVTVHPVGISPGVKLQGGILDHPLREIEVECLPGEIPEKIDVDISELEINRVLRVSDLKVPAGIKVLTDPSMPVVAVVPPTVEKAPVAAAEGVAVPEAPAEPEVIKKGKAETAEEGAETPVEKKGADKGGKSEREKK